MKKNLLVLALICILVGTAVYQNIQNRSKNVSTPTEQAPKADFLAPSFSLKSLDGTEYAVGGPRDKPLLLNFWASWCGPCEEEAPDLVKLYDKYKGKFDLYAVNVTQGDSIKNVEKFVKEHGFTFPVLLDKEGKVSDSYRFLFIPTSYLIDRDGVVREVINVFSMEEMDRKINELIGS
ncbi:thiol-disulfide isomerase/thioredoxin [Paenibacillus eucommiae]|uniref:Thiol-disulfide isomerase/thioredoxin n=1 Tax=Paenibacillus eucommiae TaxID=1355755 RepID=A0ABS4INU9_9BACL|nr:TlpA disulfide reductase family protein [Paenibacillus eucommiae]MBP1989247.1 thiol-disulfide isomerase/thioredoxin [Paenibacillus eucommiae]